jgi:hypothetical protein
VLAADEALDRAARRVGGAEAVAVDLREGLVGDLAVGAADGEHALVALVPALEQQLLAARRGCRCVVARDVLELAPELAEAGRAAAGG